MRGGKGGRGGREVWSGAAAGAVVRFRARGSSARVLLLTGLVLTALPSAPSFLLGQLPGPVGPPLPGAARPDTLPLDSTRLRVLDALERRSRPPVSRQAIVDGDSAFLAGVAAALERQRQDRAPGRTPAPIAQGADSVMALLLRLPGYEPARYEGARAEFETAEGRLTLLSRAGAEARRGAGGVTDSLFPPDRLSPPPGALPPPPDTVPPSGTRPPPDTLLPPAGLPTPGGLPAGGLDTPQGRPTPGQIPTLRAGEPFPDAEPPARLLFEGREIQADTAIRYFERTGRVSTVGRTVTRDVQGDPVESQTLIYSLEEGRGTALGARTRYSEGTGEWFVFGDANSISPGEAWLHNAMFTSCDLTVPHSHFRVDEIKIINGRVLVARPVVLYFADVPVAWLPFIAQGLGSGRTSGLLTPRFSVNDIVRTSSGYARRVSNVGFYWAMSDYSDASLALDWFSGNFTSLTGTTRYNWARRFLRGDVAYRQYWREDGRRELAFDTRHDWQIDERTSFRGSARYASSSDFVRRNSFDPRELTQSINSEGGFNRRFSWGNFSTTASRRQYLSDDRVETTFPSVNLSLSPITFLAADPGRARFYNNITWSGSGRFDRNSFDRPLAPDAPFDPARWNRTGTNANVSSGFSVGGLSWSQSFSLRELVYQGVPIFPQPRDGEDPPSLPERRVDQGQALVDWSTSLSYSQRLVGSTTLTPNVSLGGQRLRSDTIPEASDGFVDGPTRLSFGVGLATDLYGFFPGVGGFDAIRHKISPRFDYSYAPAVVPTELQRRVFGAADAQARNRLTIGLNQTFEARRAERPREEGREGVEAEAAAEGAAPAEEDTVGIREAGEPPPPADAPRRRERAEIVKLLGLQTSSVTYNFVLADSLGRLRGFETTTLSTQITSDYLRGLSINTEHEIFDDRLLNQEGIRRFSPYLTRVALGFSLGSNSGIFRRLGLFQGGGREGEPATEPELGEQGLGDESAIIPGMGARPGAGRPRFSGGTGGWNANLSYSLRRTRDELSRGSQMVQTNLSFRPTPAWDVSWQTSYDLAGGGFNDHIISLTRDLHEWEATFDFVQTATGNWSFRFNVSLVANRDLKFDYEQRSRPRFDDPFLR